MREERYGLAASVAAMLVAFLVMAGVIVYLYVLPSQVPTTPCCTSRYSSTEGGIPTTNYFSTSQTTASSARTNSSEPSQCSSAQPPIVGNSLLAFGQVIAGMSSPAILCLQLYYYAAVPITINLTTAISIVAQRTGQSFSSDSNFTVTSSQASVQMGGPGDLGEGTVVAFSITAKQNASGTFELDFSPAGVSGRFLIESQEPVSCPYYGQLVSGNGSPNYVFPSGCLTISSSYYCSTTTTSSSSKCTSIPGVSYPLVGGNIYFKIVGVTNSTG